MLMLIKNLNLYEIDNRTSLVLINVSKYHVSGVKKKNNKKQELSDDNIVRRVGE